MTTNDQRSEPITVSLHLLLAFLAGRVPVHQFCGTADQTENPFFQRASNNLQISSVEVIDASSVGARVTFHFEPDKRGE